MFIIISIIIIIIFIILNIIFIIFTIIIIFIFIIIIFFTWRHNLALKFIANSFQSIVGSTLYVDLLGFISPCIVTSDTFRPDLLLVTKDKKLLVLELAVGFETNLNITAQRKNDKYQQLLQALNSGP